MDQTYDVIIVGGGIGGLTTAHFLAKIGLKFLVLERSEGLNELGAGLWLAPNALAAFREINLIEEISQQGWPMHKAELRSTRSGLLQSVDLKKAGQEFGFTTLAIHRGILQKVLVQRLKPGVLRSKAHLERIHIAEDKVTVSLEGGETISSQLLIGADGLRSQVRSLLFDPVPLRYSGTSSYRGVTSSSGVLPELQISAEIWGPGCRFGYSHINAKDIYWYLTFDAPPNQKQGQEERKTAAIALMQNFPDQRRLVENTADDLIIHTDISDLTPNRDWVRGRVALLGDAAHATTPNLGQGAAQAIEDAWALSLAIQSYQLEPLALHHYLKARSKKALWIVNQSWNFQKMCHIKHPLLQTIRDAAVKLAPKSMQEKTLQRVFRPEVK